MASRRLYWPFQGGEGNHVHVQDFDAIRLNLEARKEIVDDLTANPDSSCFVPIDPVVTGDLSRLIRLPGSLYIRESHVGICRLIDIPGIEFVNDLPYFVLPLPDHRKKGILINL